MNALFVDTGALVARVLPRDQYHQASRRGWETLENVEVFGFDHHFALAGYELWPRL